MFNWRLDKKAGGFLITSAVTLAMSTTGCGSGPSGTPSTSAQGTIPLESVKIGMPETTIKEAILTFVPDPKGSVGGKVQYLSRTNNGDGGQYVAQCKDGKCFGFEVLYFGNPIGRDQALATAKQLLPADAPPQSGVKDLPKRADDPNPAETYYFGKYGCQVFYADQKREKVKRIATWWWEGKFGKPAATSEADKESTQ